VSNDRFRLFRVELDTHTARIACVRVRVEGSDGRSLGPREREGEGAALRQRIRKKQRRTGYDPPWLSLYPVYQ
jgi:hypothetical protein